MSLPLFASPAGVAAPSEARRTVVFLGDSLTAGFGLPLENSYPSLIEARLRAERRPWKVVNAGVSGDTTTGGLARLDWIYKQKVEVLVVALGANDGLRGIPVGQTEKNLRAILRRAQKEGSRILLVGIHLPDNFGSQAQARFASIYPRLAAEFRVPLVPFLLEGVAMDPGLNQADGIHPNTAGTRKVADHLWEKLGPMLSAPR
ncbi:MAG: arylesterase [Holophagaceae bacterium]|nr:arylesterase [Holophagaceae bacterium]